MQSNVFKNWNSDSVNTRIPWFKRHHVFFCIINQNRLYHLSFLLSSASIFLGKSSVTIYLSTKVREPLSSDLNHPPWKIQGRGGSGGKGPLLSSHFSRRTSVGVAREWLKLAVIFYICALGIEPAFWKLFYCIEKRRVSFRNVSWKKNFKFPKFLTFLDFRSENNHQKFWYFNT